MNCLLFENEDDLKNLPIADHRAQHIKKYLKAKTGDILYVAIADKFLAKASIEIKDTHYSFDICEKLPCPKLRNIELAIALCRPQIAQKILFDCASIGIKKVNFYIASKSEASYTNSTLYTENSYKNYLIAGAEQACNCYLPKFEIHSSLEDFLLKLEEKPDCLRIAPDIYETKGDFSEISSLSTYKNAILVMGGERGFNNLERNLLREHSFSLALMRERVLRTDTALVYALALLHKI